MTDPDLCSSSSLNITIHKTMITKWPTFNNDSNHELPALEINITNPNCIICISRSRKEDKYTYITLITSQSSCIRWHGMARRRTGWSTDRTVHVCPQTRKPTTQFILYFFSSFIYTILIQKKKMQRPVN